MGGLTKPTTVLLLGVDIVYSRVRRGIKADAKSFQGRSDTIMVARFDPIRNQFSVLSIPRDTSADVPGAGRQKINGANALGGPRLAVQTVQRLIDMPIDHYVVLNVHGLVELVDALGGIAVTIPKRMRYHDRAAKLDIALDPGTHVLNGTQAMGFVRFRHDALGDIGRVQRQEIFMRAVMEKAVKPESWAKIPKLIEIAQSHIVTDLTPAQMVEIAAFARAVDKADQHMVMLPGRFSGTGDWAVDHDALKKVTAMMNGEPMLAAPRAQIRLAIENASSSRDTARRLSQYLQSLGYPIGITSSKSDRYESPQAQTKVIAEKGNPLDAGLVNGDLNDIGEIVHASIGDIDCSITIVAGDDLIPFLKAKQKTKQPK